MLAAALIGSALAFGAGAAKAATIVQTFYFDYHYEYAAGGTGLKEYALAGPCIFCDPEPPTGVFRLFNPSMGTLESVIVSVPLTVAYLYSDGFPIVTEYSAELDYAIDGSSGGMTPIPLLSWLLFGPPDQSFNFGATFSTPADVDLFIATPSFGLASNEGFLPDFSATYYTTVVADLYDELPVALEAFSEGSVTYVYSPAPEPATWVPMLIGMFCTGLLLRHRSSGLRLRRSFGATDCCA
jgi:hypothetical protein